MPPLQPPDLPQPVATGPSGPPKAPPTSKGRPLKVLYLFSGVAHQLDMATCLQQLAATWTLDLRTECVDIKRNAGLDLSLPKVRNSYLDRIRAREFDAVLLSPPCASFSRATWANFRGPRPVRSYELPSTVVVTSRSRTARSPSTVVTSRSCRTARSRTVDTSRSRRTARSPTGPSSPVAAAERKSPVAATEQQEAPLSSPVAAAEQQEAQAVAATAEQLEAAPSSPVAAAEQPEAAPSSPVAAAERQEAPSSLEGEARPDPDPAVRPVAVLSPTMVRVHANLDRILADSSLSDCRPVQYDLPDFDWAAFNKQSHSCSGEECLGSVYICMAHGHEISVIMRSFTVAVPNDAVDASTVTVILNSSTFYINKTIRKNTHYRAF